MTTPYPASPDWPMHFLACRLIGRFVGIDGVPIEGSITLTPSATRLQVARDHVTVVPGPITIQLDVDGSFDVEVPATNDPNVTPGRWTYSVAESWHGGGTYDIAAPVGEIVDLTNAAPIAPSNGVPIYRGPKGDTGDIGPRGPQGYSNLGGVQLPVAAPAPGQILTASGTFNAEWADVPRELGQVQIAGGAAPGQVLLADTPTSASWQAVPSTVPVGTMFDFGGIRAPFGYLFCDGSAISRTAYATLFAVIGTSFGAGNLSTTFNLPDFRGQFAIGADATHLLGQAGGNASHLHTLSSAGKALIEASGASVYLANSSDTTAWVTDTRTYWTNTIAGATGETAHNAVALAGHTDTATQLPPYLPINKIIKV